MRANKIIFFIRIFSSHAGGLFVQPAGESSCWQKYTIFGANYQAGRFLQQVSYSKSSDRSVFQRKLSSRPARISLQRKIASHRCSVHCGKQLLINPERHLSKIQCIRIRKRALIDCIKRFHIFCIFLHDVQILTHEGHRIV